jgi:hypothetical protein
MKHWSEHPDHIVVYHGTHTRNIPHILKNGLSNKDPKTGMVSVTFGSHGKSVAHGYAAMSGEYGFRQAGQKAVTVPDEHRSIVVAHLPMDWVHKNVDRNFGGNPTEVKQRLADPELHRQYVAKTGSDFSPTETPELRFKEAIPPEFIVGVEKKKTKYVTGESKEQPMKTFKEFIEIVAEEVPANNASGEASSDGKPDVSFYDKLMRFLRRRPTKDTYNHPETTKDLAARSSVGIPGLP